MKRLFPHAQYLLKAIKPQDDYPFIELDSDIIKEYFQSHKPSPEELDSHVDKIVSSLRKECTNPKLSHVSKRLIEKIQNFPSQVRDKKLRPLFELPFSDDSLTIKVSPGMLAGDWAPLLRIRFVGGSYSPSHNKMILTTESLEAKSYPTDKLYKRPLLPCVEKLPKINIPVERGMSLHEIHFEEIFHYVMQAVFKNNCQPFDSGDKAAKKVHIEAILADLMPDGKTPNTELVKKLGLDGYLDEFISFKKNIKEGTRNGSYNNILPEPIAKVAVLIEDEGWDAARTLFPHICEDFEKRILPRCYELCAAQGIEILSSDSSRKRAALNKSSQTQTGQSKS